MIIPEERQKTNAMFDLSAWYPGVTDRRVCVCEGERETEYGVCC